MTARAQVAYTPLHHRLLRAIADGLVATQPDHRHTVAGIPAAYDAQVSLLELLFADHAVMADVPGEPMRLTPYGDGVLIRWDREHPESAL